MIILTSYRIVMTCQLAMALLLSWVFFSAQVYAQTPSRNIKPHVDDELRKKLKSIVAQADSFEDRFDAEVWLVQKSQVLQRFVKDHDERLNMLKEIHRAAKMVDIPPEFILAVIQIESRFDRYAVSSVGAQGMMQVMPFWKKEIGRESDNLMDLKTNLKYGCTILKHYLDRAKGDWKEALARYNGSYGKYWYPEKVLVAWQKYWR
ncbi:lytic transglycosylase domain-containing protein [Agarilytica rhodophyticola]|uniref:lytic transglycosylase domain-containing protein n=1 Tax=Agarilytica rhodophyticola TaxID=1737490 RepID=UPI001FE28A94|nr:lytic transglycosylase domain-containing protein [Agarilytica rhodophyticola]